MISAAVMILGSSYCEMAVGLVRSILIMNLLGPTGKGIMALVGIAHKYLTHSHLGTIHGVSKDLPIAIGRNDVAAMDEVEATGSTIITLSAIVAGIGLALYGVVANLGSVTQVALICGGGLLVTQQVFALYRVVLRAWGRFRLLATAGVVSTIAQFVLIILGAKYYHTTGAMLGWLIASIISILYFQRTSRFRIPLTIDWPVAWRLIKSGLPLTLILFADTLLRTVDGLAIVSSFSEKAYQFGLYSVAMQVATYLYRIPEAGGFVIMPRILEGYAAKGDIEGVRRHVMLPTIVSATIMPVAAGVAFVMLPSVIITLAPRFQGCIYAAQVLSLASVLLALPVATNTLLIALNKDLMVVLNKGVGAAIIYLLARYFAHQGAQMSFVAMSAGVGYFVSTMMSLVEVLGRYSQSRWELVKELFVCFAPLAWCVILLRATGYAADLIIEPSGQQWANTAVRLAMFLVGAAPVLIYGNARTQLVQELVTVARRRMQRGAGA